MKKIPLTEEMLVFNGDELDIELDGIRGKCRRGAFSIPYGDRLGFKLEKEHPDFKTDEIVTKYFELPKPGVVQWRPDAVRKNSDVYVLQD